MFGRRKREEAAAEAVREAERHALFARLAERPEHICPFLGLAAERTGYVEGVSDEHRCYAFGDPTSLSAEQQTRVCQERGYGNCPRYLRGVLVIPTEELEALRRPHAPLPVPVAPPPSPPDAERRRRGAADPAAARRAPAAGGRGRRIPRLRRRLWRCRGPDVLVVALAHRRRHRPDRPPRSRVPRWSRPLRHRSFCRQPARSRRPRPDRANRSRRGRRPPEPFRRSA